MAPDFGKWAYVAGLALSAILAYVSIGTAAFWLLALAGIVVAVMNIKASEHAVGLLAFAALPSASLFLGDLPVIGSALAPILTNVLTFGGAAFAVIGLMAVHKVASKK